MKTFSCIENLFQLGILYVLLGVAIAKDICSQSSGFTFNRVKYCEDGYYCCDDNTRCCSSGLTVGTTVGIVIGCIIVLAIIVGLIAACIFGCGQAKGRSGNVINPQTGQATVITTGFIQPVGPPGPAPGPPGYNQPTTAPPNYSSAGFNNPAYPPTNNPAYPPASGSGINQPATYNPPPYGGAPGMGQTGGAPAQGQKEAPYP